MAHRRVHRWIRRNPFPKTFKPMDLSIMSRQSVRERVARNLLLRPTEGQESAIRHAAEQINFTEESVRSIVEFVEEEQPQ